MPDKRTLRAALRDRREGKSAGTQAGEFIKEEIHHVREGKHGARSAKQAIAIGLSKARRAGVALPAPKGTSVDTRRKAAADAARGKSTGKPVSRVRSRAVAKALKHEGRAAASSTALARHAKSAAKARGASARSASARKAVKTKGPAALKAAGLRAARTRKRSM